MKRIQLIILPVFFFGFMYFMFFNQIFGWKVYESDAENRAMAEMPKLDIQRLDNFPEAYDAYINDNFTYRVPMVNFYHELMFQLGISPDEDKVLVGSNGFLFLGGNDYDIYRGKSYFSQQQLDSLVMLWEQKQKVLEQNNIPLYWLVLPMKHNVYEDYLPISAYKKRRNRSLLVKEEFDQKLPNTMIYPLDELRNNRERSYFKHDNHWTEKGAFIAYLNVMDRLKKDVFSELKVLNENEIQWEEKTKNNGNLLNFIGKDGELEETFDEARIVNDWILKSKEFNFKPPAGFKYKEDYQRHYMNPTAFNDHKILLITDSFGYNIEPFITSSFKESLFIFHGWSYTLNRNIVNQYQPDVVIFITYESLIQNILRTDQIIDRVE